MESSTVIPMPAGDKDFEEKCVFLFCGLLEDPNVKTVGTRGSAQMGLDLLGARGRDPGQPVGIQCKLKTKGGRLTEAEVRAEVEQALRVSPPLTEYYVVTTGSDDTVMDLLGMQLRQEQAQLGRRIDIQIWGWETLQQRIRRDQAALNAFRGHGNTPTSRPPAPGQTAAGTTTARPAANRRNSL